MSFLNKTLFFTSCFVVGTSLNAYAAPRLTGAGASFPKNIYTRWFSDLAKSGGPKINYQAVGSGSGRKAFLDQTVDFGASDEPMKEKDIKKVSRGLVQIPMVGGTIAFGYNYDCELKLSQVNAVKVSMGVIKDWKELGCPPGKLTWAHRSDGSGTTKAFTSSMQAFSSGPKGSGIWNLGTGKSVKWPAGIGGKGNPGVAGIIKNTPGAIGYVNQSYIDNKKIKAAFLENLAGEYLLPNSVTGAKALSGIKLDSNLAGNNPNPELQGAYPIATLTWILAYETGNGSNSAVIQRVFRTLLSDSYQERASTLGFIPLRGEILTKARIAVERIRE